jgi:hypothetical protein
MVEELVGGELLGESLGAECAVGCSAATRRACTARGSGGCAGADAGRGPAASLRRPAAGGGHDRPRRSHFTPGRARLWSCVTAESRTAVTRRAGRRAVRPAAISAASGCRGRGGPWRASGSYGAGGGGAGQGREPRRGSGGASQGWEPRRLVCDHCTESRWAARGTARVWVSLEESKSGFVDDLPSGHIEMSWAEGVCPPTDLRIGAR